MANSHCPVSHKQAWKDDDVVTIKKNIRKELYKAAELDTEDRALHPVSSQSMLVSFDHDQNLSLSLTKRL